MKKDENNIESLILASIQFDSKKIVEIIEEIKEKREGTTKQAVYAAIRRMKDEEKVVVHKKMLSLNTVWIKKQLDYFQAALKDYSHAADKIDDILLMEDGERVSYTFSSPYKADQYWGHMYEVLANATPVTVPLVIYDPHEWFLFAREESEKAIFTHLQEEGRLLLLISGSDTPLEKEVLKDAFKQWHHQYYINPNLRYPNNYYINIFGNFIIEAKLDVAVHKEIEEFYQRTTKISDEAKKELIDIVSKRGKNKLIISHNSKKAARLRKQLVKEFYIPKGYGF